MKKYCVRIAAIFAFSLTLLFVLSLPAYADETDNMVTSINVKDSGAQWNDWIEIEINYQLDSEPDEMQLCFERPDELEQGYSGQIHESFNLKKNKSYNGTGKLILQSFDPENKNGTIVYKRRIDVLTFAGYYKLKTATASFSDGSVLHDTPLTIPEDLSGFNIFTPFGRASFDKEYSDEELNNSLLALADGDVAVIRCEFSSTPPIYSETGEMISPNRWLLIKKEYFDAIKGKDVTLIFPFVDCLGVINGKDITRETKDVDFGSGMNFRWFVGDDGTIEEYSFIVCPDNGVLPCKIRYMYGYEQLLDFYLDGEKSRSKKTLDEYLDNAKIYYFNGGTFEPENIGFSRDDIWYWYELEHNSYFVAATEKPSKLRSFNSSINRKKFVYNGKIQKPTVDVSSSINMPVSVKYSNKKSKKVGSYSITVKGTKGGFGSRTYKYMIVPKGTSVTVKAKKKAIAVRWKKQATQTTGYQIMYSTNKAFKKGNKTKRIKNNKKTSLTIKKLKAHKRYYVKIRTYKKVNGKNYYSNWSKKKVVKTRY